MESIRNSGFYVLVVVGLAVNCQGVYGDGCGGTVTDKSGNLTLPSSLPAKTACKWIFPLSNSSKVYFTWSELTFGHGEYLVFYNGSEINKTVIANLTDTSDNGVVYSMAKNATVVFFSPNGINETKEFAVNYSTKACDLHTKSQSGVLTGPLYNTTSGNLECNYHISYDVEPLNKLLALTFTTFQLEKGSIDVYDGNDTSSPKVAEYTDKTTDYSDILATGSHLTLVVKFSTAKTQEGFMAAYTTVDKDCSGKLDISKATNMTSPGFPGKYKNGLDCRWILTSPEGSTMKIQARSFNMGDSFDFVSMVDGDAMSDRLIQTFSQISKPDPSVLWMTSGNKLWIKFKTDEVLTGSGFKFVITPQEYGGALIGEGSFSFDVNISSTPLQSDIIYHIIVNDENLVELKFNDSTLPPAAEIQCFDGFSTSDKLVGHFRSDVLFHPVFTSGNVLMIVAKGFGDNASLPGTLKGYFHGIDNNGAMINSVDKIGTYQLIADGGQLNSSTWLIHNRVGGVIALRLESLEIEKDHQVVVHRGLSSYSITVATFNTSTKSIPVMYLPYARVSYELSPGNHSVNVTTSAGKKTLVAASYQIIESCNQHLTTRSGQFSSPNFPQDYPYNAHCVWNISSPNGKSVRIGFKSVDMASTHSILVESQTNDNIGNVTYTNTTRYGSFTGSNIPDDLIVKGSTVLVMFSSEFDGWQNVTVGPGFQAEYELIDCGGNITISDVQKTELTLSPPGYPKVPTGNIVCVWIIEAPKESGNTSVNVINYKYELKDYSNTSTSFLEFRDGGSLSSVGVPLDLPEGVKDLSLARTNKLWIRYTNNIKSNAGKPFTFKLSYNLYECPEKDQCANSICMHKNWRCNGADDCGDGSDEKDCKYNSGGGGGGVPKWSIAVAVILTFFASVAMTLLAPALYKRVKYPNYSELRDLMTPVST